MKNRRYSPDRASSCGVITKQEIWTAGGDDIIKIEISVKQPRLL
jgi:hypothetical protein